MIGGALLSVIFLVGVKQTVIGKARKENPDEPTAHCSNRGYAAP
jgi:hypothetical protein